MIAKRIINEAVPEAWHNTALSPNDVKKWSADELEKYLDSKISFVEAKGTTIIIITLKMQYGHSDSGW